MTLNNWRRSAMNYPHMRLVGGGQGSQGRIMVRCSSCKLETEIPYFPIDIVEKNLWQRGWSNPGDAKSIICPACAEVKKKAAAMRREDEEKAKKRDLSPKQKRAAFCRINGVKPKGEKTVKEDHNDLVGGVRADPPRESTLADRRRIAEALDTHYDTGAGCYRGVRSDESVAKDLKVPRAWVGQVRELTYGPDINEDGKKLPADIDAMITRLDTLHAGCMKIAEAAMDKGTDIEVALADLRALKKRVAA